MCGIVGFTGNGNALEFLLQGLKALEYRGYDSAGVATLCGRDLKIFKSVNRIESLEQEIGRQNPENGNLGIGHTRWATHGAPTIENSHPHLSENGKFAVVHNGIIENYADLKAELIADGYNFKSETDTEVVPLLLQKYYKGDLKSAVASTVGRLKGSFALGIICSDFPETLIAAKRFSPLIIGIGEGCNLIASDVTALVHKTKTVIYLEDGEFAFITPRNAEIFDLGGAMAEKRITTVDWDVSMAQKNGFEHYMMKEITEQPDCIRKTYESYVKNEKICFSSLKLGADELKKIEKIEIVACGSAYHAGMVAKYILEELLRLPVNVDLASEFRYRNPIINEKTLTIAISQSGETADTLAALKEAKQKGSKTLAIVNVMGSAIAKTADDVIYTCAGPEIAVATTKGYTTQLTVLYLLGIWMAEILETASRDTLKNLVTELKAIPQKITEILCKSEEIKAIAKEFYNKDSVFFIGRNTDYAVALEASLKLKEISYINSQSYAAGELKHGTISLIEDGTLVVALCGCERLFEKMLSNIKEVIARGAKVLVSTMNKESEFGDENIKIFTFPETNPLLTPILEVVPFQLLSYYTAELKGCDIDKPRNLAKSVTVE